MKKTGKIGLTTMKKVILAVLCCIFVAGFCITGYQLWKTLDTYQSGEEVYEELKQYAPPPLRAEESEQSNSSGTAEPSGSPEVTETTDTSEESNTSSAWFDALYAINPDVVGWIRLDGCGIDYPIVQGEDNDYYLSHLFDLEENKSGCIFLDCRNDAAFTDRNSIIYGHNMKNGSMFAGLNNYLQQAFYEEHPSFQIFTPQASYTVNIFAGYAADLQDRAWSVQLDNDAYFEDWLKERMQKSVFYSDVTPSVTDQIITLSTCANRSNDTRFVLFGIISKNL